MNTRKKHAFTLVELIVVITILAILSTIGFVSFQGYGMNSRDSVRLADMTSINKGFNLKLTKGETLPLPENKIDITASGIIINYQGDAGESVLGNIGVHGGGVDPLDQSFYTYSTNAVRNKYQILGFFENSENISINSTTFANLNYRYPKVKGSELGIVLNPSTNQPTQISGSNIDIINTGSEYNFVINNSNNGNFVGSGSNIIHKWSDSLDVYSCADILNKFSAEYLENKNYPILSNTGEEIEVFCDMKNGGFTGLFSIYPSGTTWKFDSTQWTNPVINNNNFLTQETTLKSYTNFNTNSIKICRGDLNHCYTMNHNKNIPLQKFYTDNITHIDFSFWKKRNDLEDNHRYNTHYPPNIGTDNREIFLNSLGLGEGDFYSTNYNKVGLGININSSNKIGMQGDNNNHWPGFDNIGAGIGVFRTWNCGWNGSIVDTSRALSIALADQCVYEIPDNQMWYVLAK